MINLNELEPKEVLKFFYEICSIPHGSNNMKPISDYCAIFAKERGLEVVQDEWFNIIITKEATNGYEDEKPVIIQGHLDMVCEKEEGFTFDFLTEGLQLESDGEHLWAKGTTLGGDDGVAVAMALAVLDSKTIKHPKIEAVFTVDEEIGLVGASHIDLSNLQGKTMINIDSSDEGIITTSCAGGSYIKGDIPVRTIEGSGIKHQLVIKGLVGGHSGCDIHRGRGNSNQLMGRVLYALNNAIDLNLIFVNGGKKDNVIPNYTTAEIIVSDKDEAILKSTVAKMNKELQLEYLSSDSELEVECVGVEGNTNQVMTKDSLQKLLTVLLNFPNGIQQMSGAINGLVETSLNMGVLTADKNSIHIQYGIRSSVESAKDFLVERMKFAITSIGGTCEIGASYPGWAFQKESPLRDKVVKIYTSQYGEAPEVSAIHAGLECGIFASKINGLDCVAIGPTLHDIHSPKEKLDIKSLERTWKLLIGVLEDK